MRYDAFVSYSHGADARLAPTLQRALHRFAKPWWKVRAVHVFRDETSLAVAHSLPDTLTRALDASAHLILMASPAAAQSKWVATECQWWVRNKDPQTIMVVLSDGDIAWDDATGDFDWQKTTALPPVLKGVFRSEPLYLDLRWTRDTAAFSERDPRLLDAVARISAALRGMSLEEIAGEEVRQHRKTRRVAIAAVSAIAVLAAGASAAAWIATENAHEAERQRNSAERATGVARAEEAKAKAARDQEVAERRRAQTSQSRFLVAQAGEAFARGDGTLGDLLLVEALPRRTPDGASRPEVREAVRAATDRLRRGRRMLVLAEHESNPNSVALLDRNVVTVAYSPDGLLIATAGIDRMVRVWDSGTGLIAAVLRGHQGAVHRVVFSPDGASIASVAADGTARLWERAGGRAIAVLAAGGRLVYHVAFSPDGKRLVTASDDTTARIFDATDGRPLAVLRGHDGEVRSASFNRDGSQVVTASADRTARVWEAESGRQLAVMRGHQDGIFTAAFDHAGQRVVTASHDRTARIWDAATGGQLHVLRGHEHSVQDAAFDPSGRRVATVSFDKTARLFDAASGRDIAVLRGHQDWVTSLSFSADGRRLASASKDRTVRIWDGETGREVAVLGDHGDEVNAVAFSRDGLFIATASTDGLGRVFPVEALTDSREIVAHDRDATTVAFDRKAARLVTAGWDKTARVWDAHDGERLGTLEGHDGPVASAVFSPDDTRILTASHDGTARIWDAERLTSLSVLKVGRRLNRAAFDTDGKRVVLAVDGGTVEIWEVESGKQLKAFDIRGSFVLTADFSRDGKRLVVASSDEATVWDIDSGRELARLKGHQRVLKTAAFAPDGERVVTAAADGTARVWSVADGRELFVLRGHDEQQLTDATFSPDGRLIATAGYDGAVRLWEASSGRETAVWREHEKPVGHVEFSDNGAWIAWSSFDGRVRIAATPPLLDATELAAMLELRSHRGLSDAERERYFLDKPANGGGARDGSCAGVAAMPYDPANRGARGQMRIADPKVAIAQCSEELRWNGRDPRLLFLLARAQASADRMEDAKENLRASIGANYAMAYYLSARMSRFGAGEPIDMGLAGRMFERALERGVALAGDDLATMKWEGQGIPQDRDGALKLWRAAADAGIPHSNAMLAQLHLAGIEQGDAMAEAVFRYTLAHRLYAAAGDERGVAPMRTNAANLAQDLDPGTLQAVLRRVEGWKPALPR